MDNQLLERNQHRCTPGVSLWSATIFSLSLFFLTPKFDRMSILTHNFDFCQKTFFVKNMLSRQKAIVKYTLSPLRVKLVTTWLRLRWLTGLERAFLDLESLLLFHICMKKGILVNYCIRIEVRIYVFKISNVKLIWVLSIKRKMV